MPIRDEVRQLLDSMRGVWDEVTVDELDHALQSAARAIEDHADDELVLAAALHDLGHSPLFGEVPTREHDVAAREWLTPRFGVRVGWLAGAHVAAKRYLVAADPAYASTLSDVSVDSLHHQGGAEIAPAFVDHPFWADALRLRHYDDAAKEQGASALTIDEVIAVADRVLARRSAS
jgi:predicted HD phosphohydrolase